eukprot:scaffold36873_cov78-Phaeocystis_antarctica.AAC.2
MQGLRASGVRRGQHETGCLRDGTALRERARACVRAAVRGGGAWLAWLACLGELWIALVG